MNTHSLPMFFFLQKLHSSNIGIDIAELQNHELDFGKSSSRIAGIVVYGTERNITWFLMTSKYIPTDCLLDVNCLKTETTQTGFVMFDPNLIQLNTFYYICAYSNTTFIERELFTETLQEIASCSNGFVLDNIAPTSGTVDVNNKNGYLTSTSNTLIQWGGFEDNIDARKLGYIDSIKQYTYEVGKLLTSLV